MSRPASCSSDAGPAGGRPEEKGVDLAAVGQAEEPPTALGAVTVTRSSPGLEEGGGGRDRASPGGSAFVGGIEDEMGEVVPREKDPDATALQLLHSAGPQLDVDPVLEEVALLPGHGRGVSAVERSRAKPCVKVLDRARAEQGAENYRFAVRPS